MFKSLREHKAKTTRLLVDSERVVFCDWYIEASQ